MTEAAERRDALVERLFGATLGAMDVLAVYVGVRLGLYRALDDLGSAKPEELAAAAGLHERYVREWLEQQARSGIVEVDGERRFSLPAGHADALLEAFRTGEGIPYADYGADMHEGQAEFTRPMFEHLLGTEWLPAIPAMHERLQADPPARVADVACGEGYSTLAIARAYPQVTVDGIDLDRASIEAARSHLSGSDAEDRVTFHHRDAADAELEGAYDLVYMHESLHDMSYPVEVLQACRRMLAEGGSLVIGDERVAETFTAPGDEMERLYYGFSILHCLPVGMVGEGAAGTGTVMRAETVRRYAKEAGFAGFDVLPIENDFYRFYRLTP